MNTGDNATAPKTSKIIHPRKMNLVYFMISPRFGAETASCIVVLAWRPSLFPTILLKTVVIVTTPIPPIWIRDRITSWPNHVQWLQVS